VQGVCLPDLEGEHIMSFKRLCTARLTTQLSHLVTQKPSATMLAEHQTHYIYSESKSCGFHSVLLCIRNVRIYSSIKIKFTSAMVVLFKYGLNKRTMNLWAIINKGAPKALTPCRLSTSSGNLERLNSTDTFLRRENACTNFLLAPKQSGIRCTHIKI
jgi:hypothetical protein